MNKINFVNNSEPALSAETLNQMQDNMEEATTIETITNENGTAIKYPDGTMIFCNKSNFFCSRKWIL